MAKKQNKSPQDGREQESSEENEENTARRGPLAWDIVDVVHAQLAKRISEAKNHVMPASVFHELFFI